MKSRNVFVLIGVLAVLSFPSVVDAQVDAIVITNTRRFADSVGLGGNHIHQGLVYTPKNCFVDSGPTDSAVIGAGQRWIVDGVDYCCRDQGFLVPVNGDLLCQYSCPEDFRLSPDFVTAQLQAGAKCLTNCYTFGGCSECIPGTSGQKRTCNDYCMDFGFSGGRCANPASTSLSDCCDCFIF